MEEIYKNMISIMTGYLFVNLIWNNYSQDYVIINKI